MPDFDETTGIEFIGSPGAFTGAFLTPNVDIDGDGYSDVIIAEMKYDHGKGRLAVIYGGSDRPGKINLNHKDSHLFESLLGESVMNPKERHFGLNSFLGDINGDGRFDLFVSSEKQIYVFENVPAGTDTADSGSKHTKNTHKKSSSHSNKPQHNRSESSAQRTTATIAAALLLAVLFIL